MPKTKREEDPDYTPGKSRRTGYYDPKRDDRNVLKELYKLKCKGYSSLTERVLLCIFRPHFITLCSVEGNSALQEDDDEEDDTPSDDSHPSLETITTPGKVVGPGDHGDSALDVVEILGGPEAHGEVGAFMDDGHSSQEVEKPKDRKKVSQ